MPKALSNKHIPVLDGWRVIMLFMVSWYHIWQQSWLSPNLSIGDFRIEFEPFVRCGYMMVDGIILLSAFLLFLPYAAHMLEKEPLPSLKTFYARRMARIVPSYYFYILGAILLGAGYASSKDMWVDILRHVTFTHTFFKESYLFSPILMAVWTLAIEAQAYLVFPFVSRLAVKKAWLVLPALLLCGLGYRAFVMRQFEEYAMLLNQLPAFLDVYAIGMALALLYTWLYKKVRAKTLYQVLSTLLFIGLVPLLLAVLRQQGYTSGQVPIQLGQMNRRLPVALLFGGVFVSSALGLPFLNAVLGNRVMRFLAGISFNYYMWHPLVAQFLKKVHIPPYSAELPQMAGEMPWQSQYTYLCFILAFAVAAAVTYLVEKPCNRFLQKLLINKGGKQHERSKDGHLSA